MICLIISVLDHLRGLDAVENYNHVNCGFFCVAFAPVSDSSMVND